jgi:hypothetical protein
MLRCGHITYKEGCRICHLNNTDPRYKHLFENAPGKPTLTPTSVATPPPPAALPMPSEVKEIVRVMKNPCYHLGIALEDVPSCGCGGKSAVKHECKIFGVCRPYARDKTIQNCVGCPQYKQKQEQENELETA